MKKIVNSKMLKLLVTFAFILSLSVSLFSMQALAASASDTWTVGESSSTTVDMTSTINDITVYNDSVPSWASYAKDGTKVVVSGTPTAAGTFTLSFLVECDSGSKFLDITLTVKEKGPVVTSTPQPTTTVVLDASPAPTTTPNGKVTITKHPTSEYVEKGDTAVFVAYADNATALTWRLVSNDASNTILATAAESYFSGLDVSGSATTRLVLSNIPSTLNGWYVECKFDGQGGPVYTNGAKITVAGVDGTTNNPGGTNTTTNTTNTAANPVVPTITTQPKGANLNAGQTTTLSVTASVTDDGTIKYQWYSNSVNSTAGGDAITGATSTAYQPPQKQGAYYYYCAVWNSKDNKSSTVIYSTPVEVNYHIQGNTNVVNTGNTATTPTTGANTGNTTIGGGYISNNDSTLGQTIPSVVTPTAPVTPAPAAEQQTTQAQQTVQNQQPQSDNNNNVATTLLVILGILAVGLIAAIVFIFLKNGRKV